MFIILFISQKDCYKPIQDWDWEMVFSLLLITISYPQYINEFAKSSLMTQMENFFAPLHGLPPFIFLPLCVFSFSFLDLLEALYDSSM